MTAVTVPLAERFPYPVEPLLRHLGLPTIDAATLALSVEAAALQGWLRSGLSEEMADRLACRAGHHPGEVWPEWWACAEKDLISIPLIRDGTLAHLYSHRPWTNAYSPRCSTMSAPGTLDA